jgi:hypothetical protein
MASRKKNMEKKIQQKAIYSIAFINKSLVEKKSFPKNFFFCCLNFFLDE